jgi:hypothetical protein
MQQSPADPAAASMPAVGLGHFGLAVADADAALRALKEAGCGHLVEEECAAVIPVRSHGQSYTVRRTTPWLAGMRCEQRRAGGRAA